MNSQNTPDSKGTKHPTNNHQEPTVAPGMEMDELDAPATEQEIRQQDYTPVTKLFIDRVE